MTSGPTSVAQNILEPVLPVWPRQSICQVCSWLCWQVLVWAKNWWESRHKGWKSRKNKDWDLNKPRHLSLHQDSQTVKPLAFLFFFFFDLFIYFFYFTILYWFCHTSTWIHHGCTRVPHPEPTSHLPPHTIPLGHPGAPAPSILYPASNLDWRFVSYMILYTFQAILQNDPSLSLSHRVQKTVLYICVSFAVLHTGLSLPTF